MLRILTITLAFVAIVFGELSKTKEDKTLKDLEDKIVNDIITHKVMVYSKTYCPWSKRLKVILANYEIDDMKIVELDRSNQTEEMQEILKKYSGRTTVPQLFISGKFVGGHDETKAIEEKGELRPMLEKAHALFTNRVPVPDNEIIETNSEALAVKTKASAAALPSFIAFLSIVTALLFGFSFYY
ncbi:hypothetical protein L5515_016569 [Caenorhabditis briggsae]|uniref:Glutaredoxin domain-containing protein n=1 Tax=Caenorhabditis briggsae TaxID=6238 RepID=A0AAE9JRH0_CAEBR|nr:hypothetical protein L5515_016569 [Caenorhabditis briggsae]